MRVPGSSPLSQLQNKVVCRLWKWVERSERGRKGTAWLAVWISCVRESYSLDIKGLLPHFLFVVFLLDILGLPDFSSLYLFQSPFPHFSMCFYVPSPLFIIFLTFPPLLSYLLRSFNFLLILEIFILFLSISSHIFFLSISFLSCSSQTASLPSISAWFPLLCCFLLCPLLPPSLPPESPLHYSLSQVAGAAAVAIWDTPGGVGWRVVGLRRGLATCIPPTLHARGGGFCLCRSWDNGSCQQDGGFLFKRGNVPWKLRHLAPLHSTSDFSFICCRYECHKYG